MSGTFVVELVEEDDDDDDDDVDVDVDVDDGGEILLAYLLLG